MAKANEGKNEVKKLYKEMMTLKSKLKSSEKKLSDAHKHWDKQQQANAKDVSKKLVAAHAAGYSDGLVEFANKEIARKKALQEAEVFFEKNYAKKTVKAKGAKKILKKGKVKAAIVISKSRPAKKARAILLKAKVSLASDKKQLKKRGRPLQGKKQLKLESQIIQPEVSMGSSELM